MSERANSNILVPIFFGKHLLRSVHFHTVAVGRTDFILIPTVLKLNAQQACLDAHTSGLVLYFDLQQFGAIPHITGWSLAHRLGVSATVATFGCANI